MDPKHKKKINFETEELNNFSILDIKITHKTNGLLFRFFSKPHLVEFLLDTYKIGLVHTLLLRFSKICWSMENSHIEVEHLRNIFKCNYYPVNIIDQCIKKFLINLYLPKQIVATVPKTELLIVLPFLGKFSLNF